MAQLCLRDPRHIPDYGLTYEIERALKRKKKIGHRSSQNKGKRKTHKWENRPTWQRIYNGAYQVSLRVSTLRAEDKPLDETIQQALQLSSIMSTVDNVPLVLCIHLHLCTQLTAKVLRGVCQARPQHKKQQCTKLMRCPTWR